MSVVWIVTTGNSDVQLTKIPDDWESLCKQQKHKLDGCHDSLHKKEGFFINQNSNCQVLPARLTGIVFGDCIETHWQYLEFRLLNGFCQKLKSLEHPINPDKIILLLTDQENIETGDRSNLKNPYWKDTISLQPLLERFLIQKFPASAIQSVILKPPIGKVGLDDWNTMLNVVTNALGQLDLASTEQVILSHQAGTPATSGAVQFASLSRFGGTVSFLLGNERTKDVSLTSYSSYFESMQIQQAQKFLSNYDYVSIFSVLEQKLEGLKKQSPAQADKIIKLLEVAKLWNLSKFDEFATAMRDLPVQNLQDLAVSRFSASWAWWIAYEEAYLGIIRRKQGNIVEAFFHSFRAFEGIFAEWGKKEFSSHIDDSKKDKAAILKPSVREYLQPYFDNHFSLPKKKQSNDIQELKLCVDSIGFTETENEETKNKQKIERLDLNFMTLCKLYRLIRPEYKSNFKDLGQILHTDGISTKRNFIFHQVQGMKESLLMEFWKIDISKPVEQQIQNWEDKIRNFLNFVADEQKFETWEEASLMAQVHKELVKEIEAIAKPTS